MLRSVVGWRLLGSPAVAQTGTPRLTALPAPMFYISKTYLKISLPRNIRNVQLTTSLLPLWDVRASLSARPSSPCQSAF
ncbi:hypothetical protein BKA64DRAFT_264298 [Cadophora sp. MPI-SDFR-AT-0126]|nr:hypothetical protein BKA64DRAFT_264298 [Leotiomycetes sp. MPI-SDFR-AT-0126]